MTSALARLTQGGFSIGIEAPLDNDWTPAGAQSRHATVQRLIGNRLLMGVASGDRPVEYPLLFGRDFKGRGENFREQVALNGLGMDKTGG